MCLNWGLSRWDQNGLIYIFADNENSSSAFQDRFQTPTQKQKMSV